MGVHFLMDLREIFLTEYHDRLNFDTNLKIIKESTKIDKKVENYRLFEVAPSSLDMRLFY